MFKNFLTDDDGLSQRDLLVILFPCIFIFLVVFTYILSLMGKDVSSLREIVSILDVPVTGVISGVFGITIVSTLKNGNGQVQFSQVPQQQYPSSPYPTTQYFNNPTQQIGQMNQLNQVNQVNQTNQLNNNTGKPTI